MNSTSLLVFQNEHWDFGAVQVENGLRRGLMFPVCFHKLPMKAQIPHAKKKYINNEQTMDLM